VASGPVSALAPLLGLQLPFALGFGWMRGQDDLGPNALLGLLVIGAAACFAWLRLGRTGQSAAVDFDTIVRGTLCPATPPLAAASVPGELRQADGRPLGPMQRRGTREERKP
jgi:hypothetical protein